MPEAHEVPSRIATGTYVGDGAATQAITGVGFQPKVVQVYRQANAQASYFTKTDRDGLNALYLIIGAGTFYEADYIISLDSDGFTIGDGTGGIGGNQINAIGVTYTYVCLG